MYRSENFVLIFIAFLAITTHCVYSQRVTGWDFLGPFPTHSISPAYDPLISYGGIQNVDKGGTFPSSIVEGGEANWKTAPDQSTNDLYSVSYSDIIDEDAVWAVSNGWMLTWAVADVGNPSGRYAITCRGAESFMISDHILNGDPWSKDYYAIKDVELDEKIYVPLIRHISMSDASFSLNCDLKLINSSATPLRIIQEEPLLIPDITDGYFAGSSSPPRQAAVNWGTAPVAIPIMNVGTSIVRDVDILIDHPTSPFSSRGMPFQVDLYPGQRGVVPASFAPLDNNQICSDESETIEIEITGSLDENGSQEKTSVKTSLSFNCRSVNDTFQFTFRDADGSINGAHVTAPSDISNCQEKPCPVVVVLNPEGLPVPSSSKIDEQAFLLELGKGPSRISQESIRHAVNMLAAHPSYYGIVDPYALVVVGHSIGGHAALMHAIHASDRVIGLAAVSVAPGTMFGDLYHRHNSNQQGTLEGMLSASVADHNANLHMANIEDIPDILIRYGSNDHFVHAGYGRSLYSELNQHRLNVPGTTTQVDEVDGEGHIWPEALSAEVVTEFIEKTIQDHHYAVGADDPTLATDTIHIHCSNPASMESRHGIYFVQHDIPYQTASMKIERSHSGSFASLSSSDEDQSDDDEQPTRWNITTVNLRRFDFILPYDNFQFFVSSRYPKRPDEIVIDGSHIDLNRELTLDNHLCKKERDTGSDLFEWRTCPDSNINDERGPNTYGPAYRSVTDEFFIVFGTRGNQNQEQKEMLSESAVFLANHFAHHYSLRYVRIITDTEFLAYEEHGGHDEDGYFDDDRNLVLLGDPSINQVTSRYFFHSNKLAKNFPVRYQPDSNQFYIGNSKLFNESNTGIISTIPTPSFTNTATIIAGTDNNGFRTAFSLFPFSLESRVPDFAVLGRHHSLHDVEMRAAGYWGNNWNYLIPMTWNPDIRGVVTDEGTPGGSGGDLIFVRDGMHVMSNGEIAGLVVGVSLGTALIASLIVGVVTYCCTAHGFRKRYNQVPTEEMN
eukprot:gb/GECH01000283.1/.p1 GENE.gb/GECH01000283.1/~~gb/GECH01000283.1/.p1  ORF type:complete len:1010 (+),score=243.59 gb/GECH01000283.1/:1-3030(+)